MGYKTLQDPQFAGLANYDPRALFAQLPTPAYVIDEERLRKNGEVLAALAERTGCRVLLAQKAFSNYDFYPLLAPYWRRWSIRSASRVASRGLLENFKSGNFFP